MNTYYDYYSNNYDDHEDNRTLEAIIEHELMAQSFDSGHDDYE